MGVEKFVLPAALIAVAAYLLGSISFSIIFTKIFANHTDIRTMGSGNAGATNVLRSVGKRAAACTFACDFLKSVVSVLAGRLVFSLVADAPFFSEITQYGAYIAGVACVLGHVFPIFYGFRGGKGVLTASAMVAMIDWRMYVVVMSVFILVALLSRIVSLASILAAASVPISNFFITWFMYYAGGTGWVSQTYVWVTTGITLVMAFFLIYKHKENIKRLISGTEKKITDKSPAKSKK